MTEAPKHIPPIPVWASINRTGNGAMAASFNAGGVVQMLRDWAVPAIDVAGCDYVIVRELATPWDWLDELADAAVDLLGVSQLSYSFVVLYTNPRAGKPWDFDDVARMVRWCRNNGAHVILEQDAEFFWVREALWSAGVLWGIEPGINKTDTLGLRYPAIIEDGEWAVQSAQVGGWNMSQVPPYELPAGLIRWYTHGELNPGATVPHGMSDYYTECTKHRNVRALVYAADLFRDYQVTVQAVRAPSGA